MDRVLRHAIFKSMTLVICLLAITQLANATTFTIPSDEDLIIGSRAIVVGKVLSIESAFDERRDRIYTYITVKVREVLKGEIAERKIVLKELGGEVGDEGFMVFGNARFARNERVLLYLDTWADGSLRTHQLLMGKFAIVKDGQTGHEFVSRSLDDDSVTVLRSHSHGVGADPTATDRMEFSTYKEMVRSRLAANRRRARQFENRHYRNIPLLARPAEFEGIKGRGEVHADWTYIHTAHPRWFEPDSGLPVTFMVNPDQAPNPQINDDIVAAMNVWSNVSGTSLELVNGGATSSCLPSSAENVILFNGCDGRWSPTPSCSGTLALGGLGWNGNTTVVNGVLFHQARSGFVSFNPYASCSFGNHCNVQEVATHELGHAIGLGHSADSTATMFAIAHFDGRCAGLRQDDMSGVVFIYPGSGGGGPPPLSVVTSTLPNATVGTAYSQNLSASGGTPPYSWSLLSGNLPNGLNLSSSGAISGMPTNIGTFSFSVRVTDSASATADKALAITVVPSGSGYNSQFVSQSVPTSVTAGQPFNATLTWFNNGTQSWDGASGLRLLSRNPDNNTTWGGNTVLLTNFFVFPGQQLSVTFQAIAPSTPGSYNFQWTLAANASTPFGQPSTNVVIQVGGGAGTNGATFISQSVPTSMTAGQTATVSLTFNNSGTNTWAPGSYLLTSLNPLGNTRWGLSQVPLATSVAPGSNRTFTFTITAPSVAGTYNFQWGMMESGVGVFGDASTNVPINVTGGGGGSGNQSQFVSQTVPSNFVAGQTYTVTVRMKNIGTTMWSPTTYKLGSQNPANNMNWGRNRVNLTKNVFPGSTQSFTFTITVPTAPGTYNFQWQMIQETVGFFGALSTNIPVTIGGSGGGTNNASFISQSVPTTMNVGQVANVSLTFRNTGTTTWTPGSYLLTSLNPQGNTTWGVSQIPLSASVAPATNVTFSFAITAPGVAGTYNFQWGMMQSGVGTFGAPSTNVSVSVTGGGGGGSNNAQFVSQNPPTSMTPGQVSQVSVVMRNNGTTTWAAGTYSLQSQNPANNTTWGLNRVNLAAPIAPGANGTFTFNMTAPATAGTYNFQWRMAQDGVGLFGELTPNVAVNVSQSGTPPTITTTSLPNGFLGLPYSKQMTATGGTTPYTWSISAGGLPPGLSLNSSTGLISGTPTSSFGASVTIMVRGQNGQTATRSYTIFVF